MEFIINYWYIVVAAVIVAVVLGIRLYRFYKLPRAEQIAAVKEWLLMAVTEAEKVLGEKTGKLKLRYVYDRFVARFPWLAPVMGFDWFSELVDEALIEMRDMLESNEAVKEYVKG